MGGLFLIRCDCAIARFSKRMQQLAIAVAELNSYINATTSFSWSLNPLRNSI